ncbi:MAG: hypothetical protein HYS25_06285 [Ignavibacteriales bacterium]|nr:hypothetical protein [Ignavibacteriales bacterium]
MAVDRIRIKEGNTGILYLSKNNGTEERYIPDSDLEKTRELLLEFQELRCENGKLLKDNYKHMGYNWYPTMVSFLYWRCFFPYVRYKTLLHDLIDKKTIVDFQNKDVFYSIYRVMTENIFKLRVKLLIFYILLRINNLLTIKRFPYKMMFFRFSFDDFRSVEIRNALDKLGVKYIQVVPPGRTKEILKYMLKKEPYYYYRGIAFRNRFKFQYDLSNCDQHTKIIFIKAIDYIEKTISASINEFKVHDKLIRKSAIKVLYGFDDCNEYIFPLLYALNKNGIPTIAHQHGAYVKRHAGYIMEGIEKEDYKWFDKIIVWGKYWKNHLLAISKVYSDEKIVIGSSKIKYDYSLTENTNGHQKNILIPYEFVGNTYKIGRYIEKFLEFGYNVYFKPRPDEEVKDQLAAYCLSDETLGKIIVAGKLDKELMRKIDIVAGAMTTLVYEMLPYNKIIWILDTEYKHLEDLVEDGYAHKVKYEDIETLSRDYFVKTKIESENFFCPETLPETLTKQVIGYLN